MPIQSNTSGGGGSITETDPIYTADKPNIALKSEIPDVSGFATTEQLAIQNTFNFDYTGTYTEFTKVGDLITGIDYWDTASKVNKLFTKTITYSGTNPTVITLVDEKNSKTLTTTIAYSGSNITSITKAVS